MAQLGNDERAPNVSASMRRRIGALLDNGNVPTLRGNLLRLGDVVLSRADGRDTPRAREVEIQMRRRNMPMAGVFSTYGPAAPVRRGRGTYATHNAGVERMITRRIGNENRVTQAERRFYRQPYTRWVVRIPTYRQRRNTGGRFCEDAVDVTGESLGIHGARGTEAEQLQRIRDAVDEMMTKWDNSEVPRHFLVVKRPPLKTMLTYITIPRDPFLIP